MTARALLIGLILAITATATFAESPQLQQVFSTVDKFVSTGPNIYNATTFPLSATGYYVINIVANSSVVLCLQGLGLPSSYPTAWNEYTCAFYWSAQRTGQTLLNATTNALLSQGAYSIGLASSEGATNSSFTIDIYSPDCGQPNTFGNDCDIVADGPLADKSPFATKLMKQLSVFYFNLSNLPTQFISSAAVIVTTPPGSSSSVQLYIRYGGLPGPTATTASAQVTTPSNSTAVINVTLPTASGEFFWYVAVAINSSDVHMDVTLQLAIDYCNSTVYVLPCGAQPPAAIATTTPGAITRVSVPAGGFVYLSLAVTGAFSVSATSVSGSAQGLTLFLRKGALPLQDEYDLAGCSRTSCSAVAFLNVTGDASAIAGKWYVGIYGGALPEAEGMAMRADAAMEVLVWTYLACPNNCSNRGHCDTDTGVCTCQPTYKSIDCSVKRSTHKSSSSESSSGLATKYIILIVVLCGAAAGVLVGLIVWVAYKKRKQASYMQM